MKDLKRLESRLLKKLQNKELDGGVVRDLTTGDHSPVTIRHLILDGIPQKWRIGSGGKYFNNKENVRFAGKVTKELYTTTADKLSFLQRLGWLIDDKDAKEYSSYFKPKKK